jgi:hypothetical protein
MKKLQWMGTTTKYEMVVLLLKGRPTISLKETHLCKNLVLSLFEPTITINITVARINII